MTVAQAAAAPDEQALAVLDLALQATAAYERPDLSTRLQRVRERIADPRMRVLVVGEFKQGKSSLVNGLVTAPVCPVDDDVATSVPTTIHHAGQPTAVALHAPEAGGDEPRRQEIGIAEVARYASEAGNPGNERNLWAVEVGLPRALLASGLVLVDTPGVGGLGSAHSAITIGALPSADAVLLCTDASQELTAPELEFLQMARDLCPTIACVLTKTDFYPEWRRIAERNRRHLAGHGIEAPVLPTSASLRLQAATRNDREVNVESGYPPLLGFLRDRVVGNATQVGRRVVASAVDTVAGQLAERFAAEQAALASPERSEALVADLDAARERSTALRDQAARWQQTLSDGFADLAADADHDLRGRMRETVRKVDDAIADVDPGKVWDQLEQWVHQMVSTEVAAHYARVTTRAEQLATQVAEHFAEGEAAAAEDMRVIAPLQRLRQIDPIKPVEDGRTGVGAKGLVAMRGSYGGVMMIGIIGAQMGMSLFNPLSVGFGLVLGRKAIRDDRERALAQRRGQARQACRTYVDDVSFAVSKDARDGLRRLQRTLRDTFTEQAEQVQRSTTEALDAAKRALQADKAERSRRLRDVEAELQRIEELRRRAAALVAADAAREPAAAGAR